MARQKKKTDKAGENVVDYRHKSVTRLNIPPAGLTARGEIVREKKVRYAYNPHLSPVLRFDATGKTDSIEKLIDDASRRKLEPHEIKLLQEAMRNHEPWLEWAGKREQQWCVADPVALHIHERISTQAILRVAKREDVQRNLFADPEQEYHKAVQFYKHPMDWTNRIILGDSLAVIASLARREALAGKVQMIYMDPPYGIKYASNFQPEVGRRDVKDRDEDLTREPEMVKAYRDTWTLGVHSYLSYLRDRLLLCKELLADAGSIFVQIGEENLHVVRNLMDEVFSQESFCRVIPYVTTSFQADNVLGNVVNYLLWYAKNKGQLEKKVRALFRDKSIGEPESKEYKWAWLPSGEVRPLTKDEYSGKASIPEESRIWRFGPLTSQGFSEEGSKPIEFRGNVYNCGGNQHWKTNREGIGRLIRADHIVPRSGSLSYFMFLDHFSVTPVGNLWVDTKWGFDAGEKAYVVQTNEKIIERCILMTTEPGDLVLDPTCGSGTTAFVAEEWGRRWITIDVSRVAIAIARQRLLTAKFDYYRLRPTSAEDVQRNPNGPWLTDPEGNIQGTCTFDCKTVPHITLKSIAQNQALDPIFEKWEPVLVEKLAALNKVLVNSVTKDLRKKLLLKLQEKIQSEGKKSITDADERRWKLPEKEWKGWEVPFDTDPDWPEELKNALIEYRQAWRQKMDEINDCIAARADQEELVDQTFTDRLKVRVSGPFTMEGVIPAEESIDDEETTESPIGGAPEELETFAEDSIQSESQNAEAYLDRMIRLLRGDGVRFPDNKVMKFNTLEALADGSILHAKGTWGNGDGERQVAVMFGPQYGSLTTHMVEDGIRIAARRGYDDLVFAAFSFTGEAQVTIQDVQDPDIKLHMAQIRPDVNMGDLLKTTVSSQLFTVSGSPRTKITPQDGGQFMVHMEGVDIYDPVTNTVRSTGAEKVAAWFLDSDYDGRCFCVCQAFFPDKSAWERLGKALGSTLDAEAFASLSGTVSLPFPAGQHKRIAVKVIDPRGNEVMRVHRLSAEYG
jgi:adenine-specific DNA-methyltransferase